jgi:hypothetical protein
MIKDMTRSQRWGMAAYGMFVAALAGIASALGVFVRGDGSFQTVTSVRGITYEMASNGVYAFNAKQLVAEGVGWDVFTLAVVVPAALGLMLLVGRGSFRALLASMGVFGYLVYEYLEYAVTWAFGPLFVLFVAICALSIVGICWFASAVAREGVAGRFSDDFPRRAFVLLNVTMAALLGVMWSGRIASGLSGDLVAAGLFGETTLVVQALDLGLVVPVALITSFIVARRSTVGYAIAAVWTITSVAMATAIVSMLISSGIVTGVMPWPPMIVFGLYIAAYSWVAFRIFAGIRAVPEGAPARASASTQGARWVEKPIGA